MGLRAGYGLSFTDGSSGSMTATQIRDLLETLTGNQRLNRQAIRPMQVNNYVSGISHLFENRMLTTTLTRQGLSDLVSDPVEIPQ